MEVAVCFSGGKDSALAALVLEPFYEVTLVTGTFGVTEDYEHARAAAEALGFPFETVALDRAVAEDAVERMVADGFPRNGIQQVHEHCLEVVAGRGAGGGAADSGKVDSRKADFGEPDDGDASDGEVGDGAAGTWDAVADGTRRDDRVPRLDRPTAQSLEDRHDTDYVAPLAGVGSDAVEGMAERALVVERGPSEAVDRGDYEAELRALLAERHGAGAIQDIFPRHTQSVVRGRADSE